MKTLKQRFIPLLLIMIFLTGCFGPKSPQDVTQAFWKAVITQKVDDVIEYSTLVDAKTYTAFNKNWIGYQPVIGGAQLPHGFIIPGIDVRPIVSVLHALLQHVSQKRMLLCLYSQRSCSLEIRHVIRVIKTIVRFRRKIRPMRLQVTDVQEPWPGIRPANEFYSLIGYKRTFAFFF